MQHHSTLTSTLDKQLETEKTKCSRLTGDLMASSDAVKEFSSQLEQTKTAILEMEETLSELRSEVVRLTSLEATHLKQISFISDVIENFLQVIRYACLFCFLLFDARLCQLTRNPACMRV